MQRLPKEQPSGTDPLAHPRLQRIRFLSRLLDESIQLPGGYRIGIDPLLGLLPGFGDFVGGCLSVFMVYEAARLGISKRIVVKMLGNVAVEALAGSVPLAGDVFDAVWKANMRNLRLIERHFDPASKERSPRGLLLFLAAFMIVVFGAAIFIFVSLLQWIQALLG